MDFVIKQIMPVEKGTIAYFWQAEVGVFSRSVVGLAWVIEYRNDIDYMVPIFRWGKDFQISKDYYPAKAYLGMAELNDLRTDSGLEIEPEDYFKDEIEKLRQKQAPDPTATVRGRSEALTPTV